MHHIAVCWGVSEGWFRRSSSVCETIRGVSLSFCEPSQEEKSEPENKHGTAHRFHTEARVLIKHTVGANPFKRCFCAHKGSLSHRYQVGIKHSGEEKKQVWWLNLCQHLICPFNLPQQCLNAALWWRAEGPHGTKSSLKWSQLQFVLYGPQLIDPPPKKKKTIRVFVKAH